MQSRETLAATPLDPPDTQTVVKVNVSTLAAVEAALTRGGSC